jgi:hypothetical protein
MSTRVTIRVVQLTFALVFFVVGVWIGLRLAVRIEFRSIFHPFSFFTEIISALLPLVFGLCGFFLVAWWEIKGKRLDPSKCMKCGYDLRATPDRCPECGMVPSNEQKMHIKGLRPSEKPPGRAHA